MNSNYPPDPGKHPTAAVFEGRVRGFWRRVTDGLEMQELWGRFLADARAGYGLYSKEVDWEPVANEPKSRRIWRITKALFWAMVMKLSPPRRVLLVLALALLLMGIIGFQVETGEHTVIYTGGGTTFLAALALIVLLALELADRVTMKRDLEIAKEIQHWLVPDQPPILPGVEIGFASRAANTVAGDYYDAFERPGIHVDRSQGGAAQQESHGLMVVVADVAGKSVPAALLMATLQASLRTLALAPKPVPELITGLNAYSCEHSQTGRRFITAFLAELDLGTRKLSYVNAGHNQPMLFRANAPGALERLSEGGLPLGIMTDAVYQAGEVTIAAGDRLFIFTDGAIEAENERAEEFGEGRLLNVLWAARGLSAAEALRQLMAAIDAFVGHAPQHDDITCLILDCR